MEGPNHDAAEAVAALLADPDAFKAKIIAGLAAQVDRSPEGQDPQGLDAQHESAVVADDAPITGMGKSDQEGA